MNNTSNAPSDSSAVETTPVQTVSDQTYDPIFLGVGAPVTSSNTESTPVSQQNGFDPIALGV